MFTMYVTYALHAKNWFLLVILASFTISDLMDPSLLLSFKINSWFLVI